MQVNQPIFDAAERSAAQGASVEQVLIILRELPLDDYGLFMFSLPNPLYPALSRLLPAMVAPDVQRSWTGVTGVDLVRQSASFIRLLEWACIRHGGKGLDGANILDFGCGYGRLARFLYYFTDPDHIWGFDAWASAIKLCHDCKLPGQFLPSDAIPARLPLSQTFDVGFAYSVFTSLPPKVASACLAAIRRNMNPGALFVLTIRPVEYWRHYDKMKNLSLAAEKEAQHKCDAYAFYPHEGRQGLYGEASYELDYFNREGWHVLGYDRTTLDSFQIAVILKAV